MFLTVLYSCLLLTLLSLDENVRARASPVTRLYLAKNEAPEEEAEFIGLDPVIHTTKKAEEERWIEHLENYTLSIGLHLYCLSTRVQSFRGKGAQRELKSNLE